MKKYLVSFALLFSACAQTAQMTTPTSDFNPEYVEVFMSRASFSNAEFEQFKATPGGVFAECGLFTRGRSIPEHQAFVPIDSDVRSAVNEAAWDVYQYLDSHPQHFEEPGKSDGMLDPGQVFLTIESKGKRTEVKTSVNSIANMDGVAETKIRRLVRILRGAPSTSECGGGDFYGIGAPIRVKSEA